MSKQLSLIPDDTKQQALNRLVVIADRMEQCEEASERRELNRDYRQTLKEAGITDSKGHVKGIKGIERHKIEISKADAVVNVKAYLDIIQMFEPHQRFAIKGDPENIIVSHSSNWSGVPCEIQLMICDPFYFSFSGFRCVKNKVSLFSVKQVKGYGSMYSGLVSFGLDILKGEEKVKFWNRYAAPYNEALEATKKVNEYTPTI